MFTIRLAICDDDPVCLQSTLRLAEQWAIQYGVPLKTELFENGDKLLDCERREKSDIILLDIMMPLLNGMDTAKEIREFDPHVKIVFLSSSCEYGVASYDVKASGYLLKPIVYQKFCEVLNDCARAILKEPDTLVLHIAFGYQTIYTNTIEYLEAQNKKVTFTLSDGSRKDGLDTLSHYEQYLTLEKGFFKCHRSYIVYIPAVAHFTATEIRTKSGMRIPIARGFGKAFQNAYFEYMFQS